MPLTHADKLALMLTSAPSKRALAAYLGVSHQQLGRWLQGPKLNPATGELTNIPRERWQRANIDAAYTQYKRAVREHNRLQRTPYTPDTPLMARRLIAQRDYRAIGVRAGEAGRRVVVDNLGHIPPELKRDALASFAESGQFVAGNARSIVDLVAYFKRGETLYRGKRSRRLPGQRNREAYREQLIKKIKQGTEVVPIYTKTVDMRHPQSAADEIMEQVRQKHDPAAITPGTVTADQFVFTTYSETPNARKQKRKAQAPRKHIRGRGPK